MDYLGLKVATCMSHIYLGTKTMHIFFNFKIE